MPVFPADTFNETAVHDSKPSPRGSVSGDSRCARRRGAWAARAV